MANYPFLLPGTVASGELGTTGAGGFLGFWFENTSGEPIVITQLGRWQRAGNNQVHSLRVYAVTTHLGAATLLGSVSVNCAGATVGAWLVGTLSSPITIGRGVKFVVGSEEFTGGDTYGNNGGTSFVTSGIGNTWSASVYSDVAYKGTDSNRGFGPVNFWYSSPEAVWTKDGTTYSTDGTRFSVQGAHDDAAPGDTILVPEGSVQTWGSGGAALNLSKPVTLTSPGVGATIIIAADAPDWDNGVIRNSGGAKVDNFTFQQIAGTGQNNSVLGCSGASNWRVTRCTYIGAAGNGYFVYFGSYGLIDNCTIIGGAGNDEWIFGRGPNDAWQSPSQKGTANAVYIENCTMSAKGYLDANANANVVVRFCSLAPSGGSIKLDGHGTATNSPPRSFRSMECYRNHWTTSNSGQPCFEIRGGTGFIWGNTALDGTIMLGDYRVVYGTNTVGDYPLYDQIGTGQDPFPASAAAEPLYLWNNLRAGSAWTALTQIYAANMAGLVNHDRDYFEERSGFNGTTGVGSGIKAQMLAITPTLAKVAFWVTNEASWNTQEPANTSGQLYQWNGSAWVLYYTPYTYPHPLRGGAVESDTTAPTPNPSVVSSATPNSTTQITVVAELSVDVMSPPVQYNHAIGEVYQGWQSSPTREFTGLTPDTAYVVKVKARDAALNETAESVGSTVTTDAPPEISPAILPSPLGNRGSRTFAVGIL